MKKILLASVALLGFAGAASAADLPVRAAPPAPIIAAVPVFTWTGFYVGVNAGYGWNANDSITVGGVRFDLDDEGGFVGGAQAGYNYQIGSFVVGLEGDIQYADFGGDDRFDFDRDGIADDDFNNSDWFGTVRARAGVAFDRALIYATGGFAFADDATGWTVGGGLEYAFTNNLSAKVEGLYVNLDQDDNFLGIDSDAEFGVVRAGLNFRFGTY
ncbi:MULTISPECIES: outer membrane protein [Microvirga]|jgi:outer membrane immunogenic protein|uniref:Porin family protein n=1 Tax=Microvirga tunisiensis TaxID=2108360 RepID=A0A5N7MG22_9HYPH|nr:outer membrane protein [Microvirga tunisiensis]MPR07255.1 porin family protein [Microvirga tunisiensis]MPR25094.1 porin family protein [Microvirga tunisiensis]